MSNYLIQGETLTDIATAIRSKSGTVASMTPEGMPQKIIDIGQIPINPVDPSGINVYIVTDDQAQGTVEFESYTPTYQQKTVTPTGQQIIVTPDSGHDALSQVTVEGDSNLIAENIKKDVAVYGVTGTYEGSGSSETLLWSYNGSTYSGGSTNLKYADCSQYSKIRIEFVPQPSYASTHGFVCSQTFNPNRMVRINRTTYAATDTYYNAIGAPLYNPYDPYTQPNYVYVARGFFFSSADGNLYFAQYATTCYAGGSVYNNTTSDVVPRAIYGIA